MPIPAKLQADLHVKLFADERKRIPGSHGGTWCYVSLLVVPSEMVQEMVADMLAARAETGFRGSLKFGDIDNTKGERWAYAVALVDLLFSNAKRSVSPFGYHLFGFDMDRLDPARFGSDMNLFEPYAEYYNRFFRTAVLMASWAVGRDRHIIIDDVYHDSEGQLEKHDFFPTNLLARLKRDPRFGVGSDRVVFVSSDHEVERRRASGLEWASHLVQYADLLVGTMSHCLDHHCPHDARDKLARKVAPLLRRMCEAPGNPNSRYNYHGKYSVGFFPSRLGRIFTRRSLTLIEKPLRFGPRRPH